MAKILVTEDLVDEGLAYLREKGHKVDVLIDPSTSELAERIAPFDALIVHPNTRVDTEILDAAANLKIIGRAGVTVDNIDVDAASERGIVVCNAPRSNTYSAAEHAMALMLAAARNIPRANEEMHAGSWKRESHVGTELYGKTLAIFGLGRIGGLVAERAAAFGMNLIGYDPYCSAERALHLNVKLSDDLYEVIGQADFITVHLPRKKSTVGMFGADEFAAMKDGVILINAARGGLYDIEALADFVAAGKVRAVAIDAFEEEPCTDSPLHPFDNVVLTPHLSPLTHEAQLRASMQIAESVCAGLEGGLVATAVNLSPVPPEMVDRIGPYVPACKMMGSVVSQVIGRTPKKLEIEVAGNISDVDPSALVASVLDGILSYKRIGSFSAARAESIAHSHGIALSTKQNTSAAEYASFVKVIADGVEVAATLFGNDHTPRIISLLDYKMDIVPARHSLVFEYVDAPGRIGVIGTILGKAGVNITTMQIGTKPEECCALVYLNVEGSVTDAVLERLRESLVLRNLWVLDL